MELNIFFLFFLLSSFLLRTKTIFKNNKQIGLKNVFLILFKNRKQFSKIKIKSTGVLKNCSQK